MARLGTLTAPLTAGLLVAAGLALAPAYADDPPVAGSLESGDSLYPNQGNGGYDVSHYDLDITWNPGVPGGTVDATTTITATTTGAPLSSFGLDLEGLTVTQVTVNGAVAGAARINEADVAKPGKHKLVVTPATPVSGAFTVVVDYEGTPTLRGGETAGSDEGWIATPDGASFLNQPIGSMTGFPNNDTPKDKATYTVSVDVPAGVEVVSNGEPQLPLPKGAGARSTWVWNQTRPMASELATIGIGQYDVKQGTVALSGGRTVPEWSFVDSALSANAKATFDTQRARLSSVLTGLEAFLGPYPGASTGIVLDTTGVGYALETQDRPTWSTAGFIGSSFVHELVHQWYGDAVAPADWNGLWVNEGMATWAPTNLSGNTEATYFGEWSSTGAASNLWKTPPSGMTYPAQLFGWQSYDRGAMTYEALRAAIGDAAFFQLIKKWQADYGGQTRRWTDLIAMAQQLSGRDLTAFFQDWIYDADKPAWPGKLGLTLSATPAGGAVVAGTALTYTLTAANTGRVPVTGAVMTVDLADVLDDATLAVLPADATVTGTTLTWAVPPTPLADLATTSFTVSVRPDAAAGHTLSARSAVATLGGTCVSCTVSHTISAVALATFGAGCGVVASGKPRVGRTLTARLIGCPAGTTLQARWLAGGKPIKGATRATYRIKPGKRGTRLSVQVVLRAPGYADGQRVSPRTRKVR